MTQTQITENKHKYFVKRGEWYCRIACDLRAETSERFTKKCNWLGVPKIYVLEKMVEAFIRSQGSKELKFSGDIIPKNPTLYVNDAIESVTQEFGEF